MNDEMYKMKYLKYKEKYVNLKSEQDGGALFFSSKNVINTKGQSNVNLVDLPDYTIIFFNSKTIPKLKMLADIFNVCNNKATIDNSEIPKSFKKSYKLTDNYSKELNSSDDDNTVNDVTIKDNVIEILNAYKTYYYVDNLITTTVGKVMNTKISLTRTLKNTVINDQDKNIESLLENHIDTTLHVKGNALNKTNTLINTDTIARVLNSYYKVVLGEINGSCNLFKVQVNPDSSSISNTTKSLKNALTNNNVEVEPLLKLESPIPIDIDKGKKAATTGNNTRSNLFGTTTISNISLPLLKNNIRSYKTSSLSNIISILINNINQTINENAEHQYMKSYKGLIDSMIEDIKKTNPYINSCVLPITITSSFTIYNINDDTTIDFDKYWKLESTDKNTYVFKMTEIDSYIITRNYIQTNDKLLNTDTYFAFMIDKASAKYDENVNKEEAKCANNTITTIDYTIKNKKDIQKLNRILDEYPYAKNYVITKFVADDKFKPLITTILNDNAIPDKSVNILELISLEDKQKYAIHKEIDNLTILKLAPAYIVNPDLSNRYSALLNDLTELETRFTNLKGVCYVNNPNSTHKISINTLCKKEVSTNDITSINNDITSINNDLYQIYNFKILIDNFLNTYDQNTNDNKSNDAHILENYNNFKEQYTLANIKKYSDLVSNLKLRINGYTSFIPVLSEKDGTEAEKESDSIVASLSADQLSKGVVENKNKATQAIDLAIQDKENAIQDKEIQLNKQLKETEYILRPMQVFP